MAEFSRGRPYIQAGFGAPERQNRWTVAFRLILAIPHVLWLVALSLMALILGVLGWLAALVMGRLPVPIATFFTGYITYVTRLNSYLLLMYDRYPPFSVLADYPLNLEIPWGRVRRLAVLFRIFLLIGAGVVSTLVTNGLTLVLVFLWLVVLVAGRMPLSLFGAVAAIVRFQARFSGYTFMLTGKYPGELFGDGSSPEYRASTPEPTPWTAPGPPLPPPVPLYPAAPPPSSMPGSLQEPQPPATPPSAPGMPTPPPAFAGSVFPPPLGAPPPTAAPRTARLLLSRASKRILVVFILLGVFVTVAQNVLRVELTRANLTAYNQLTQANDNLKVAFATAQAQENTCAPTQLVCLETYQKQVASAFTDFRSSFGAISFPSSVQADVTALDSDTDKLISDINQLAAAPDVSTYNSELGQVQSDGGQFDTDLSSLASALL